GDGGGGRRTVRRVVEHAHVTYLTIRAKARQSGPGGRRRRRIVGRLRLVHLTFRRTGRKPLHPPGAERTARISRTAVEKAGLATRKRREPRGSKLFPRATEETVPGPVGSPPGRVHNS